MKYIFLLISLFFVISCDKENPQPTCSFGEITINEDNVRFNVTSTDTTLYFQMEYQGIYYVDYTVFKTEFDCIGWNRESYDFTIQITNGIDECEFIIPAY